MSAALPSVAVGIPMCDATIEAKEERPGKRPKLESYCSKDTVQNSMDDQILEAGTGSGSFENKESITNVLPKFLNDASQGSSEFEDGVSKDDKKLRRKQSNRESARRSRLRKQAESEALSTTVSDLQQENFHLRTANKAMAARIDELVAQLEEKDHSPSNLFRPTPRNGAFKAVLPTKQPLKLNTSLLADR